MSKYKKLLDSLEIEHEYILNLERKHLEIKRALRAMLSLLRTIYGPYKLDADGTFEEEFASTIALCDYKEKQSDG